jgi:hypothetical protein
MSEWEVRIPRLHLILSLNSFRKLVLVRDLLNRVAHLLLHHQLPFFLDIFKLLHLLANVLGLFTLLKKGFHSMVNLLSLVFISNCPVLSLELLHLLMLGATQEAGLLASTVLPRQKGIKGLR